MRWRPLVLVQFVLLSMFTALSVVSVQAKTPPKRHSLPAKASIELAIKSHPDIKSMEKSMPGVRVIVKNIRTEAGWAVALAAPTKPVYEAATFILNRKRGKWAVVEYGTSFSKRDLYRQGMPKRLVARWFPDAD